MGDLAVTPSIGRKVASHVFPGGLVMRHPQKADGRVNFILLPNRVDERTVLVAQSFRLSDVFRTDASVIVRLETLPDCFRYRSIFPRLDSVVEQGTAKGRQCPSLGIIE